MSTSSLVKFEIFCIGRDLCNTNQNRRPFQDAVLNLFNSESILSYPSLFGSLQ